MSPTIMKIGLGWGGGRDMEKQLGGGRIRHFKTALKFELKCVLKRCHSCLYRALLRRI